VQAPLHLLAEPNGTAKVPDPNRPESFRALHRGAASHPGDRGGAATL